MKPSFARLSTKKSADVDEQKKQRVKDLRDEEKGILKELGQRYFQSTEKELLEVIRYIRGPIEMLVELTVQFKEQFGEAKREKNILDFTDMEHFALADTDDERRGRNPYVSGCMRAIRKVMMK